MFVGMDDNSCKDEVISIDILWCFGPLLCLMSSLLLLLRLYHMERTEEVFVDVEHCCPILEHSAVIRR
jgi:hypothetical protein